MAVNTLTFDQCATILTAIHNQATGSSAMAVTNVGEFVSVLTTTWKTGKDQLFDAINIVLRDTYFAIRPYYGKLSLINRDAKTLGGLMDRKISYIDTAIGDEAALVPGNFDDGDTVDQYVIKKAKPVQTAVYGQEVFSDFVTIKDDMIEPAFQSYEEFRKFWTGVFQNIDDKIEKYLEDARRAAIVNFIGAKCLADTGNVIHLITEYNAAVGYASDDPDRVTSSNFRSPAIFPDFSKFVIGRIMDLSEMMTERNGLNHMNLTAGTIMRHTPKKFQKAVMLSKLMTFMKTNVISDVFNKGELSMIDYESINYWQSPIEANRAAIDVRPRYIAADGSEDSATTGNTKRVQQDYILGVIFDRDAIGMVTFDESVTTSPYNAKGRYRNQFYHLSHRYWNDLTENGYVLVLD